MNELLVTKAAKFKHVRILDCDPKNPTELQMHERNIHEEGRGKVLTYVTLEMSGECKTMGKRNGT